MLKAVQCDGCGYAFTVAKLAEYQQVVCPGCNGVVNIPSSGLDKNTIIGNRYQIKEILEESPVSNLYMAADLDYEDFTLLRVFSWGFSSGVSNLEDFLHTITSVSHLAEPVHVRIIDSGVDDGQIYTVWPYEDMESLDSIVSRSGPLSPAMAVSIVKDLALSLDKAFHSTGAGHYNFTPKCIYMNSQGAVKYSDYGVSAHLSSDQRFIQSGFPLWNMHFLSPEMALGWSYPDLKSDMYALASVLYFLVTGTEPYAGARSVQEINHDSLQFPPSVQKELNRTFEDFFYSMTARNPAQRYMSWSEAVSKMDEFLFEQKAAQKSSVSQRHRASLTKVHEKDTFDSVRLNPNERKKKLKSSKSHDGSQKRMSAEDVRRKLSSVKEGERPAMSFAKEGSGGKTSPPGNKSSRSVRMKSGTSSRSKGPKTSTSSRSKASLAATGSHAAVQKKKQSASPPAKKSKTTGILVLLGIIFGLMVIGFIVIAALGKNKKPKLAQDPNEGKTPAQSVDTNKGPKTGADVKDVKKPEPLKPEPKPEPVVVKKPEPLKPEPKPEPKTPTAKDPDRFKQLVSKIRKGVADRGSNPVEVQEMFDEAYSLADSVAGGKKQLDVFMEEFEPRRALAKRLALNEVVQIVRNLELKRKFDEAVVIIESYSGPFGNELKDDLAVLKEKTLKRKEAALTDPSPDMKKPEEEKTEEMKKEEVAKTPVEEVTIDDLAEKIASAQTSIALILLEKVQERYKDKVGGLAPLKKILEGGEEDKINAKILEGFKKLLNTQISLINKGQKMSGKLLKVDEEDKELVISVDFNGRTLPRTVKLDDIHLSTKLPLISGTSEIERVLLRTIYMIRANELIEALKYFDNYTGPLKKQIRKSMLSNLNGDSIGALSKVLNLVGLPDIAGKEFDKQIETLNVIQEDSWLAAFLLNRYKVNYSSTEHYIKNEAKINTLSELLNNMASSAKAPTVIVSETGGQGTKTLENALREAKSGDVIRILPGVYEGTLEIRQRSISLYGASGVILNTALKVSDSRVFIKQITFTDGNLTLTNDVDSVDIVNCMFTKDGVNMLGGNSSITMKNSVIYGVQAGENKRTKIEHCTILERKVQGNADNYFTLKGYINGEVKNSIIVAEKNYGIRFAEKDKSTCAYKFSLMFAPKALALMGTETIADIASFKKDVARVSSFITEKPEFLEPVSGDFRLKDFSPGFLAGEEKRNMGVQMNADLKLIDVK